MRQGLRPEQTGPAAQLYGADAGRYTTQNAALQANMATLAAELLGLQPGGAPVLADIGCGSGLSCGAVQARSAAWAGTDVTLEMLRLAAAEGGCGGHLAQSDFGQGLPLRPGCLDGAISVSAVQWLCSSDSPPGCPPPAMRRFFAALRRCLAPGAAAALQVYPEDNGQALQLVAGARQSGLDAGLFVSFPHTTAAKKLYLLARRPPSHGGQEQGAWLSRHCCSLAWPKPGSCLLSWARQLQQQRHVPAGLLPAIGRMQREHAAAGRHMLRLLRRAEMLSQPGSGMAAGNSGVCAGGSEASGSTEVLQAELQMPHYELQPCGGPIFVQLTTAAAQLGSTCASSEGTITAGVQQPEAAAAEEEGGAAAGAAAGYQAYAPAAVAAVRLLLTGRTAAPCSSASSSCITGGSGEALHVCAKAAEGGEQHAQQPPLLPFYAPPAGSTQKAHQFMQLEPLERSSPQHGPTPRLQEQQRRPLAAVLHAHKAAQHLALRFSCGMDPCNACSSASGCEGGTGAGGTCGSLACCTHVARCLRSFCAGENASVVAVDAWLHPGRQDSTWLLFVADLQQRDRAGLAAALERHFA